MKTRTELRSLRHRLAALEAEIQDPTCQKFPTARAHVQAEINRTKALLERGA